MVECKTLLFLLLLGFSAAAQKATAVLQPDKIVKLIPDRFQDFYMLESPQSKLIAFGEIRYSMAEKRFTANKKRSIKILLFDFKEAPIMYKQATKKFSSFVPIESDSLIVRSVLLTDCSGWETFNVKRNFSQILLGVCDRFFLTIEGTNIDLSDLKMIVKTFDFSTYPK
jgi:hypothetical protein